MCKKLFVIILILAGCSYHSTWHREYYFCSNCNNIFIDNYKVYISLRPTNKSEHHIKNDYFFNEKGPYRLQINVRKKSPNNNFEYTKMVIHKIELIGSVQGYIPLNNSYPIARNFEKTFVSRNIIGGPNDFYENNAAYIEDEDIILKFEQNEIVTINFELEIIGEKKTKRISNQIKLIPKIIEGEDKLPTFST